MGTLHRASDDQQGALQVVGERRQKGGTGSTQ